MKRCFCRCGRKVPRAARTFNGQGAAVAQILNEMAKEAVDGGEEFSRAFRANQDWAAFWMLGKQLKELFEESVHVGLTGPPADPTVRWYWKAVGGKRALQNLREEVELKPHVSSEELDEDMETLWEITSRVYSEHFDESALPRVPPL